MKPVSALLVALTFLVGCWSEPAAPKAEPPMEKESEPVESAAPSISRVQLGVEVLLEANSPWALSLAGKKLGLVTNPSGVDGDLVPTADRMAADERLKLVQLYGPEHGIRGDAAAGDSVGDERDALSGLPVQSLYGSRKAPTAESLAQLDALVFDIQDIGSRTYTYVSTLGEVMKACAAAKKPLIVLDRPNPIGGTRFEGGMVEERFKSFIGWGPLPVTHGMTVGEVARFYNAELALGCELVVVPMRGWRREMTWDETGLRWTTTSPHIPRTIAAQLYVTTGMVATSTTNTSDGVGTTLPFELIAAEWIDGYMLAAELERYSLPGVHFQPTACKPFYGKYKDKHLRGVRLVLEDPRAFEPLRTAIALLVTLRQIYPDRLELADETAIGKHWGSTRLLEQLRAGATVEEIEQVWSADLASFAAARSRALLY